MNDKNPVNVSILGQNYTINCPPDREQILLDAADLMDQQMSTIRNSGRVHGLERMAIMAALNIGAELMEARAEVTMSRSTCQQLNQRIAQALEPN